MPERLHCISALEHSSASTDLSAWRAQFLRGFRPLEGGYRKKELAHGQIKTYQARFSASHFVFIDPKSQVPIFQQIAAHLRKQIGDGVYQAGESLPSLRVMAVDIRVNPNTVQRAYELLEREGIVESRRGVGVFVKTSDRRRQTRQERSARRWFAKTIQQAIDEGLSPDRIRHIFDHAMEDFVREATES